jgi:hypothetical protein
LNQSFQDRSTELEKKDWFGLCKSAETDNKSIAYLKTCARLDKIDQDLESESAASTSKTTHKLPERTLTFSMTATDTAVRAGAPSWGHNPLFDSLRERF